MAASQNEYPNVVHRNLNEVFALSFAKARSYEEATSVTERVLIEFSQSGKTSKGLSLYQTTLNLTSSNSGDDVAMKIEDEGLRTFLQMEEDTRMILVLTYIHQLGLEQVGEIMDLSVGVVKETLADVEWREEFTSFLLNLCDEETEQMIRGNVERQLSRRKNEKKAAKYGSAVLALLLFLVIGSYVIQKPVTKESVEASPPIHEVIHERLLEEGYPQIKVGLTQEKERINIQVVGSQAYYQDAREKVKAVTREMLDERGYERYDIVVEPMAVERHISN